jgi:hypothetical protein
MSPERQTSFRNIPYDISPVSTALAVPHRSAESPRDATSCLAQAGTAWNADLLLEEGVVVSAEERPDFNSG